MSKWARLCIVSLIFSISGIIIALTGYPLGTVFAVIGFTTAIGNVILSEKVPGWTEVKKHA